MRLLCALLLLVSLHAAEEGTPLFERVLAFNLVQEPELDQQALRTAFTGLVEACRAELSPELAPSAVIGVLNRHLLGTGGELRYRSNLSWRDATLAAAVLRRRGNCLAGATLYACIGEALDLPIHAVLVPGHALARWDDGERRINIETTAGGISTDDELYFHDANQASPADRRWYGWGESASGADLLAILADIAATHHYGRGDRDAAIACLDQALAWQPRRVDRLLQRAGIQAEIDGDRAALRRVLLAAAQGRDLPPSVQIQALGGLANAAAAERDFLGQREYLLQSWKRAPRTAQQSVLMQLAFCHRSLKDWRGAVRYLELALVLTEAHDPNLAGHLYNFAILQKNDGDLPGALRSIDRALQINPESWNLQVLKAGYLCLAGRAEEGAALFAGVTEPRAERQFWLAMRSWFFAVSGQREAFIAAFARLLDEHGNEQTLIWIDQDVDLDPYREDPDFIRLVAAARAEILGAAAPQH